MNDTVFITGDRTPTAIYPILVAVEMLRAVASGAKVLTGVNTGVEQIVREYGELAGIDVTTVDNVGEHDWAGRAEAVHQLDADVVYVHVEPHASSMLRGHLDVTPEDALRIVTHADLMV